MMTIVEYIVAAALLGVSAISAWAGSWHLAAASAVFFAGFVVVMVLSRKMDGLVKEMKALNDSTTANLDEMERLVGELDD